MNSGNDAGRCYVELAPLIELGIGNQCNILLRLEALVLTPQFDQPEVL